MPKPFRKLTLDEFRMELRAFARTSPGVINAVHMHHTWRPDHSQWRGLDSVEAIWRFHTEQNRWVDIGQHVTIDPEGCLWTGRDWRNPPCSAPGHNGTRTRHPFMFELAGNFDIGHDTLEGAQRETALAVIAEVQKAFGLEPETLRFHNQMGPKTCPGTSISYEQVLDDVGVLHPTPTRSTAAIPDPLRGHLVHLTRGRLSPLASFRTAESDLDELFARLAARRPRRILLWAGSGLLSEAGALAEARELASFCQAGGIYPIYFLWETGLLDSIRGLLDRREKVLEDRWDGSELMTAERLVRRSGGVRRWQAMKDTAAAALKQESGGAWHFARRLASFCTRSTEVHLGCEFAGAVFLSYFVPAALRLGMGSFRSAHFVTPAMRTDSFDYHLRPHLGTAIRHMTLYARTRDAEQAEPCSRRYPRSILQLASRALEPQYNVPMLGLDECLRDDLRLAATFGLAGTPSPTAEVVWSPDRAGVLTRIAGLQPSRVALPEAA